MIITREQIAAREFTYIGSLVLQGLVKNPGIAAAIVAEGQADVRMTVNGVEIDIQTTVDHWQSQIERSINEEAVKLVSDKFESVREKMCEFTEALEYQLKELESNAKGLGHDD